MPTMKPTTMIAQCTRRSPMSAMSVVAMRVAPPDTADAVLERFDDAGQRHPRHRAQAKGYRDQHNEGMEFEARDQNDQRNDRQEGVEQQERVLAHAARFTRSATIASGVSRISHTHACSSGAGSSSVVSWLSSSAGGMKWPRRLARRSARIARVPLR